MRPGARLPAPCAIAIRAAWPVRLTLLAWLAAAAAPAQLLNSERIEQEFGSYGVDVVYSDDSLRLSNLYSLHDGRKITRTVAFVGLPAEIDPAIAGVHRTVLAGGSLGASFTAAGWEVVKSRHAYFRVGPPPAVLAGMAIEPSRLPLAAHAYELAVVRDGLMLDYALIIEMHHPDYLTESDLEAIYGPEEIVGMVEARRRLLERGFELFSEAGLTLSQ